MADSGGYAVAASARRADALGTALASFLDKHGDYTGGRNGPYVSIVIDRRQSAPERYCARHP
ncbi:MAG: hypothetical protein AB7L13_16550 [Acidimicrobiia bacterium]